MRNIFIAVILFVVLQRINEDASILTDLVYLQEQPVETRPESSVNCVRRAVWGKQYAEDPYIVSRLPRAFAYIMEVVVHVCGVFGLTVFKKKAETMCMPAPHIPPAVIYKEAAGRQYKQSFTYLAGVTTECLDVSTKIGRQSSAY